MIMENGQQRRTGQRRLNHLLTEDQRYELEAIPIASASPSTASAAAAAVFRNFVRRGRLLANRSGVVFPEQMFVTADLHLQRTLGALWPLNGTTNASEL